MTLTGEVGWQNGVSSWVSIEKENVLLFLTFYLHSSIPFNCGKRKRLSPITKSVVFTYHPLFSLGKVNVSVSNCTLYTLIDKIKASFFFEMPFEIEKMIESKWNFVWVCSKVVSLQYKFCLVIFGFWLRYTILQRPKIKKRLRIFFNRAFLCSYRRECVEICVKDGALPVIWFLVEFFKLGQNLPLAYTREVTPPPPPLSKKGCD